MVGVELLFSLSDSQSKNCVFSCFCSVKSPVALTRYPPQLNHSVIDIKTSCIKQACLILTDLQILFFKFYSQSSIISSQLPVLFGRNQELPGYQRLTHDDAIQGCGSCWVPQRSLFLLFSFSPYSTSPIIFISYPQQHGIPSNPTLCRSSVWSSPSSLLVLSSKSHTTRFESIETRSEGKFV